MLTFITHIQQQKENPGNAEQTAHGDGNPPQDGNPAGTVPTDDTGHQKHQYAEQYKEFL